MSVPTAGVAGVVLAGGHGRRMGGDKAAVQLAGRPLISYPVAALLDSGFAEVAVVVKTGTVLPKLPAEVQRWVEPERPQHPLTGIVQALRSAAGRSVFVCAADMVLLDLATVAAVCAAAQPGDVAVVAEVEGRLQPLCALYGPAALRALQHFELGPLTAAVEALSPRRVPFADAGPFFNANGPEDLLHAAAVLSRR